MPRKRAISVDGSASPKAQHEAPGVLPLLLTAEQAAGQLNLARARVYKLLATNDLPSIRIGRARRIPLQDLNAYVTRLRRDQGLEDKPVMV